MEVMAASGTKGSLCRPTKPSGGLPHWPRFPFPAICLFLLPELLPTGPCGRPWTPSGGWPKASSLFAGNPNKALFTSGCFSLTHPFKEAWAGEEAEAQKGPRRDFAKLPSKPWAETDSGLELRFLGSRFCVEKNPRARRVS